MRTSHFASLALTALLAPGLSSGLGPALNAQTEGTTRAEQPVKVDRGQKRLLHTLDGRILRVRARQVNGSWEVKRGKQWDALPASYVIRTVVEKDVLKEAKRLGRELGRKAAPARRVAYADWLAREGLFPESVAALDRVFEEAPNEPAALSLLERVEIPLRLPTPELDLNAFCSHASASSPAGREIAITRLREAHSRGVTPELRDRLNRDLVSRLSTRRSFAALALRRMFRGESVKPMLSRALLDPSRDVRRQASLALAAVGDPAVAVPALKALAHRHPKVRLHAAEALGDMGYPETVEPMISFLATAKSSSLGRPPHQHIMVGRQFAFVQDFDVEVAQNSAIADPVINVGVEGAVLDVAVLGISQITTQLATVRRSLGQLTGHDGRSNRAWKRWWSDNGEDWQTNLSKPGTGPVTPSR